MTFFEKELRKIVGTQYPEATYVGRACYVRLSEMNRARVEFTTMGYADRYEALRLTILNRQDGPVDKLAIRFVDVWGKGQTSNLYVQQIGPYAWTYNGKTEWYSYQPTQKDYEALTAEVSEYLEVFMEQAQTAEQQWQQTM